MGVPAAAPARVVTLQRIAGLVAASVIIAGAPARGDVTPGVRALAVDAKGDVFVSRTNPDAILIFRPDSSGNVAPARVIEGYRTDLADPQSIAVDRSGRISVLDANPGSACETVATFAADANGDAAPAAEITGTQSGLCKGGAGALAVDASGSIYVTRQDENSVEVFLPGGDGDAVPAAVIGGPDHARLHGPLPIAVTNGGKIYVGNTRTSSDRDMSVSNGPNGLTYNSDFTIEPPGVTIFAAGSSGDAVRAARFDHPVTAIALAGLELALIGVNPSGAPALERWQSDSAGAWSSRSTIGGLDVPISTASDGRGDLFVLDDRCEDPSTLGRGGAALLEYRLGSMSKATKTSTIAGAKTRLACP